MCFIVFLGALYSGYDETNDREFKKSKRKRRKISYSEHVIKFITEVMGEKIDPFYKLNGDKLYKMYRHGLVHLYQPKSFLQPNGKELKWFAYKGSREQYAEVVNGVSFSNVRHVGIILHPEKKNIEYLAVSINCLYYDLIQVIDIYVSMLEQDKTLQTNFISTTNAICELEVI